MSDRVKQNVRYWGYLVGKVVVSCAIASVFLCEINYSWTPRRPFPELNWGLFGRDLLYTSLIGLWFLFVAGLLYLSVLDQRYRCRVCLRRLRMPIERGSWSRMLQFGRPEVEYICVYGHGRLNVPEVQISGIENPAWKQQGDMWSELYAADAENKK
jgi:hypothetical protein